MKNENAPGSTEINQQAVTDVPVGLVVTPSAMIEFLLQGGSTASEIEDRVAANVGFVSKALSDDTPFDDATATKEIKRLRDLYLKEQLKSIYRAHPFTGSKKAAAKVGISEREFDYVYNGLISSGELKYKMSMATWLPPEKQTLMREHIVKS